MMTKDDVVVRKNPSGRVVPVDDGNSTNILHHKHNWYQLGKRDIYFLGLTCVLGGQSSSWNMGLTAGLYPYLIIYLMMGFAYFCFCLCMAEVTGALPFAGGSYGIARCTLGFFPAFIIGIAEIMEYIASVACAAVAIGDLFIQAIPSWSGYEPLIWAFVYILSTGLQVIGGGAFWIPSFIVGLSTLVIGLIYIFGCLGFVNFGAHALGDPTQFYVGGMNQFMYNLPYAAWSFLGVEALNFASNDLKNPQIQIPMAQVSCIGTILITGLSIILVTVSLPIDGGIATISNWLTPLTSGFTMMFHSSPAIGLGLAIPSQFGTVYGLSWAHTKLISAMSESKLLPSWLSITSARFQTHHNALIVGTLLGYGICLLVYFYPDVMSYLFPICLLFAFMSYSGQCIGYISLTFNYPIAHRSSFKNPLGIVGALYSLCVWLLSIIGICAFQGRHSIEFLITAAILILMGCYYWFYARHHQTISEEESKILLVAHISRFNAKKRKYHPQLKPLTVSNTTIQQLTLMKDDND